MDNKNQIQIRVDEREAKGVYSNVMEIKSSKEEFCIDFLNIFPPIGALTARVIISPGHLKRMLKVLQNTVVGYESKFGKIDEAQEPPKSQMGFHTEPGV